MLSSQETYRLKIRRKHLYEDALREFRGGFPWNGRLKVVFIGEPAVDTGGPLREFLTLLNQFIQKKSGLRKEGKGLHQDLMLLIWTRRHFNLLGR